MCVCVCTGIRVFPIVSVNRREIDPNQWVFYVEIWNVRLVRF